MSQSSESNGKNGDMVGNALERVVNHEVESCREVAAYLCSLRLPKQFAQDASSNGVYKKIQSDFCKYVMRETGNAPRYIAVRTDNKTNPEYAICLFTKTDAQLDKPEVYAEKAREIANTKAGHAGWGNGKLDVVEVVCDGPRYMIASQPITITGSNMRNAMNTIRNHLQKCDTEHKCQRTIFVSMTK